ncbi:unnamed protein product [Fraxinus pennsylvanica]|uniref:Uncharacterized protein n=1 Tax=Fraxinus pennsylvanica TaxID=56036 RepID=A0AAD2EGV1_9LAMI|nr:unnamed protein product [Fraxinus pennsylvanica]
MPKHDQHKELNLMMNRQNDDTAVSEEVYNIIPLDNFSADHPCRRFPQVRLAIAALHAVGDLRPPQFLSWNPDSDLLDWLGLHFVTFSQRDPGGQLVIGCRKATTTSDMQVVSSVISLLAVSVFSFSILLVVLNSLFHTLSSRIPKDLPFHMVVLPEKRQNSSTSSAKEK